MQFPPSTLYTACSSLLFPVSFFRPSCVYCILKKVLGKGIHITKRDMFYTDVKLFKDQAESDAVLDDVACMVGCTRSCLNVVASDKGLVVGRVSFLEDGAFVARHIS